MQKAVDYVRKSGVKAKRVGVEMAFLPADAAATLRGGLADSEVKDGLFVLERLRAKKRPDELAMLRKASELVVDSMKAVIAKTGPGMTKRELFETLRREEVNRGLTFEYLPAHGRHQPQPRPVGLQARQGRYHLARTRAPTITATSATSAAWPSSASRMRSSRTCSARSR